MCNKILHKLLRFVQKFTFIRLMKFKMCTLFSFVCDNKRTFAAEFFKICLKGYENKSNSGWHLAGFNRHYGNGRWHLNQHEPEY